MLVRMCSLRLLRSAATVVRPWYAAGITAGLIGAMLMPFSVQAQTGASAKAPPAASPSSQSQPSQPSAPVAPVAPVVTPPATSPLTAAPSIDAKGAPPAAAEKAAAEKAAATADSKLPEKVPHIALLLPTGSKVFGRVADSVRLGFLAGAAVEGKAAPAFRIYAADDEAASMAGLYRKAVGDGATAIVGGVTRDGAAVLVKEAGTVPTLALNAPPDMSLPDRFYYISLNLDWEAKLVARTAFEQGVRRIVLVTSGTPLARRIQESFEREWSRQGGEITLRLPFSAEQADGDRIRAAIDKYQDKETEKYNVDGIFLCADTRAARSVRPYLPASVPAFATSHTLDSRAGAVENLDLESVRFLEMPWFVEQDHAAVMVYARPSADTPIDNERLYALGIDAWRLARLITEPDKLRDMAPLDGVTGRLSLEGGHQFMRALSLVEMRDGRPQAYPPQ